MFGTSDVIDVLRRMEISHVVTVPDSVTGRWQQAIAAAGMRLISVCREGEAWAVAAGLHVGGSHPLVIIQCTGLFESGDAMRNVIHDYELPLYAFVGYRSFVSQDKLPGDTARKFSEPILQAWEIDYELVDMPKKLPRIAEHYAACRRAGRAGVALIAE